MILILVVAIVLATSVSSSSAAMWAMRQVPNPPPTDAPPEAGGEVAADTQAPAPKVTAGPNVKQDWNPSGKIVYGKCEGADCGSCPVGSMKVSPVCKGWVVKDKKSCWNPMTNTFSKNVCNKREGCTVGQAGVVTAADLDKATGPMCPNGSKPVDNNDKVCINPQSMQISGKSTLEEIKAYNAARKGGMKAMQAYFSRKNPSESC